MWCCVLIDVQLDDAHSDTLFHEDFNLERLISRFRHVCSPDDGGLVTYYTCRDEGVCTSVMVAMCTSLMVALCAHQ